MKRKRFEKSLNALKANIPLILTVLGLCAGIMVGDWIGVAALPAFVVCGAVCLVLVVGVAVAVFASSRFERNLFYAALFVVSIVATIGAVGFLRYYMSVEDYSSQWSGKKGSYLCTVVTLPKESAKTWSVDADLKDAERGNRRVRLRLMKKDSARLEAGDILLVSGVVQAPHNSGNPGSPDFAGIQRRQGIEGVMFCMQNQWKPTGRHSDDILLRTQRLRGQLVDTYRRYFEGRELAVLSALTLGDKTMLTSEVRDVFSETGTSHVLALSGLHLGILFGMFLFLVLHRMPKFSRRYFAASFLGIGFVWLFVFFVGMPVSLVRAALMCTIVQGMEYLRTPTAPITRLGFAAVAILFVSPQALFDVGFQLSFLSVLGIMLFRPLLPTVSYFGRGRWARLSHWVAASLVDLLMVSICATLLTLPLVAYYFNVVPMYGLFGSIVVVCLAYPLLILGFLFFVLPFGRSVIAAILGFFMGCMMTALEWLSELPAASFRLYPSLVSVVMVYVLILVAYAYFAERRTWKVALMGAILVGIVGVEVYKERREHVRPEIVVYQNFSTPVVHCIESQSESYLWTTRPERIDSTMSFVRRTFWQKAGLATPNVLRSDTATSVLHFSSHVLQFHGKRMALLYKPLHAHAESPLHVDYLFIVRGWNRNLADALRVFRPDTLILDASLSDFYRNRFTHQADSLRIPTHDVSRDGAVVINLTIE